MPLSKLWSLTRSEGHEYLKFGSDLRSEFGYIAGIRPHSKEDQVRLKFSLLDKPRALSLKSFSWDDNSYSRLFKGSGGSKGFIEVWNQNTSSPSANQCRDESNTSSNSSSNTEVSQRNAKRQADKLPPLVPAAKIARISAMAEKQDDQTVGEVDDKEIEKYFIGFYMLPINTLIEPPDPLLVRKTSRAFIDSLKQEMLLNPISDVQPILCMVCLKEGDEFAERYKEAYKYQTIGGNHSRVALHEILQEHPGLSQQRNYTHRLCSVYSVMPTQLALCLASKHNRASTFCHEMTTWDKILMCRRLLFDMAGEPSSEPIASAEPPEKPPAWRKSCAVILSQRVDQLDDAMIFNLSSLPAESFSSLSNIYKMYADGKLKGQHVPRSKKGTMSKPPDLKGSKFKGLRGMDSSSVIRLLKEVEDGKVTLKELASECSTVKTLAKVQAAFIKGTNCEDWHEAITKYPQFCTSEQLEPFTKLSFSSNTLPNPFLRFCQRAMQPRRTINNCSTDDIFCVTSACDESCIFWREKCLKVSLSKMRNVFEGVGLDFSGFSLAICDTQVEESESLQLLKEFCLLVRTLNFHVSLQDYTIIFLTPLKNLGRIVDNLDIGDDTIQLGVCNFYDSKTGSKVGKFDKLEENVGGVVMIRCGNSLPLTRNYSNCFSFMKDSKVKDSSTKKDLISSQKPVLFYETLLELFTSKGEWILDGYSGVGSCSVAAMNCNRNCLALECDPLLFIQSKVRLTSLTSKSSNMEAEVDEEIVDQQQ